MFHKKVFFACFFVCLLITADVASAQKFLHNSENSRSEVEHLDIHEADEAVPRRLATTSIVPATIQPAYHKGDEDNHDVTVCFKQTGTEANPQPITITAPPSYKFPTNCLTGVAQPRTGKVYKFTYDGTVYDIENAPILPAYLTDCQIQSGKLNVVKVTMNQRLAQYNSGMMHSLTIRVLKMPNVQATEKWKIEFAGKVADKAESPLLQKIYGWKSSYDTGVPGKIGAPVTGPLVQPNLRPTIIKGGQKSVAIELFFRLTTGTLTSGNTLLISLPSADMTYDSSKKCDDAALGVKIYGCTSFCIENVFVDSADESKATQSTSLSCETASSSVLKLKLLPRGVLSPDVGYYIRMNVKTADQSKDKANLTQVTIVTCKPGACAVPADPKTDTTVLDFGKTKEDMLMGKGSAGPPGGGFKELSYSIPVVLFGFFLSL